MCSLDLALGCGGIPRGRVIELFGPESSGKTTLALFLAATCQASAFPEDSNKSSSVRKGVVAFIDAEHAFDPVWATNIGVDVDRLIFNQPSSGEEALDITSDLVDTGQVDLIIIDSVASLTPQKELDGEISDYNIGAQASLMSKALRRLTAKCGETGCTIIFINQVRDKIGGYGNPEVTPGGKALKFYASVRIRISGGKSIDEKGKRIGRTTTVKIVKNKCGPPFTSTEFNLMYGSTGVFGPDTIRSLVQAMCDAKLITVHGSFFHWGDQKFNGRENLSAAVTGNIKMQEEMAATFAEQMRSRRIQVSEQTDEEFLGDAVDG